MDARDFRADWVTNGPMIPNLTPAEAIVRLKLFQQMFEVRKSVGLVFVCPQIYHISGSQHGMCHCNSHIQLANMRGRREDT